MTNTNEEMSVVGEDVRMKPTRMRMMMAETSKGASCDDEAPAMHEVGAMVPHEKEEFGECKVDEELVTAVGNAAKAYRKQKQPHLRSSISPSSPAAAPTKEPDSDIPTTTPTTAAAISDNMNDGDHDGGGGGGDVDDDHGRSTTKKNEVSTLNGSSRNTNTTRAAAATTSAGGDDDGVDYVGKDCEEEYGSYKTSGLATQTQSEQFIQPQKEELAKNALISNLSLFLVQAWNWLHYLFVTIIFLNLVHFGQSQLCGESVVIIGENANSVEVQEGTLVPEESESGNVIDSEESSPTKPFTQSIEENNAVEADATMSPNTCSIQNNQQEVEKAEEAIIANEVQTEKSGIIEVMITPATPGAETQSEQQFIMEESAEEKKQQVASPEDEESDGSEDNLDGPRRDSVDSVSSEGSGNLGDTEDGSGEKSEENSNDGDSNSDATSNHGEESAKEVAQKIISQVEAMFSDDHLAKDGFLLKHVRRRSDGFVSLKLVAGLRKVKQISRDFPVVLDALKDSGKLEVNTEGTKIRRVEPLTSFLKAVPIKAKDKDTKGKDKESSSNDETQQAANSNQHNNKSGSKAGKENDNGSKQGSNRRHSAHVQNNANPNNGSQNRRNSSAHSNQNHHLNNRKSSNTSTGSSNNSSRHNSFSKAPGMGSQHPADLFRNVYMASYPSSGDETQSSQVARRRGGSLPVTALQQRSNGTSMSPNSSPPNGAFVMIGPNGGARPKSNSYCEGACPSTMSPWLQRRKASASSRLSSGDLTFNGVVRQPRGPDGTKGFASGYRAMIIQERLQQQSNSAVSA